MPREDLPVFGHGSRRYDDVLQFTHIARVVVSAQFFQRFHRHAVAVVPAVAAVLVEESLCQRPDILLAVTQRRQFDIDDRQTVEQVAAQRIARDQLFRRLVDRSDDADIHRDVPCPADTADVFFLQDAQQLALQIVRHRADLIEQQRAAVRLFEQPRSVHGAGKTALGRSEQNALQQTLRNGCAVLRQERAAFARPVIVNALRKQLLAGAGFAVNEDRCFAARGAPSDRDRLFKSRRTADQIVERIVTDLRLGHLRRRDLFFLQRQDPVRHGLDLRDITGQLHRRNDFPVVPDRHRRVDRRDLLAVDIEERLLLRLCGVPLQRLEQRTLILRNIRKHLPEVLSDDILTADLLHVSHLLAVDHIDAVAVHDMDAFVHLRDQAGE